ncbi:MAG TPA: PKD domain-containing protein, partial [Saprospiraceae bacterium]|nr:PKD domain-containing protein [Saprospiraceae bacterium]HMQ85778.1 PKD domain-containing protein [Saprospiraceae bacterium]
SFASWLKIVRSGNTFTSYASVNGSNWTFVKTATLNLPNCIEAGVYAQSVDAVNATTVNFNQVALTDAGGPPTTLFLIDSLLSASPGDTLQICVNLSEPCACNATSVELALNTPVSPHLSGFSTQTLTFAAGESQQCFDLVLGQDPTPAAYTFGLQNPSGGNNAVLGGPSVLELSVTPVTTGNLYFCGAPQAPPVDTTGEPFVTDRFGYVYTAAQVSIPDNGGNSRGFPTCDCQTDMGINTGYFDLWFLDCDLGTGSGFDDPALGLARRTVACQVFQEIANMIPMPSGGCDGLPAVVNVQIRPQDAPGFNNLANNLGGQASAFYPITLDVEPGLDDGFPWLIINTGEVPPSFNGAAFFHGYVHINFNNPPPFNWFLGIPPAVPAVGSNEYDLYTVIWHEALHMLGFASRFHPNAIRTNRYDSHLRLLYGNGADIPVLENINPPSFNWQLNGAIMGNDLFSSCQDPVVNGPDMLFRGALGDYPVHTGDQLEAGTSHSHLCEGFNYLMSPALPQEIRRTITADERDVLCSQGYSLVDGNATCGCVVAGIEDTGEACGALYTMSLCDPALVIPVADLIQNDIGVDDILHVEMMNPTSGTVTLANGIVTFTPSRIGLAVFAYLPVGCNGQEGNITQVFVQILADPACPLTFNCEQFPQCADFAQFNSCVMDATCHTGNNCNLLTCNSAMCGIIYGNGSNFPGIMDYFQRDGVQNNGIAPNWYRVSGTPDLMERLILTGDFVINLNQTTGSNNFEGVITPVMLTPNTDYLVGFDVFMSNQNNVNGVFAVELINGNNLQYGIPVTSNAIYNGVAETVTNVNITNFATPDYEKRGAGCFSYTDPNLNVLWFHPGLSLNNDPLEIFSVRFDNVEIIEDQFSAGDDLSNVACGTTLLLGQPFCMISDLEIRYQWLNGTEVIADYQVLNGVVTIIHSGNIDPITQELTWVANEDVTLRLTRTIVNAQEIDLPADFAFCSDFDDIFIDVLVPDPPDASFNVTLDEANCSAQFNSITQDGSHQWTFGDGTSSAEANPAHAYLTGGSYLVTHTLTGECGAVSSSSQTILLNCCQPPMLSILAEPDGCGTYSFNAQSSGENPILVSYVWDFGDGHTDNVAMPVNTYTQSGTYTVTLTAVNDCGELVSSSVELVVSLPEEPEADFLSEVNQEDCQTVIFSAVQAGISHQWFIDDTEVSTSASFTHVFEAGTFLITHIINTACGTATTTETISITPCITPLCCPPEFLTLENVSISQVSNYQGMDLCIKGVLTIDENAGFAGVNISLEQGARIIILPQKQLDIRNCHLYGCDYLWRGITLEAEAALVVSGSILEDALHAIEIMNKAKHLVVTESVFDNNYRCIYMPPNSASQSLGFHQITDNEFLCTNQALLPLSPIIYLNVPISYSGIEIHNLSTGFTVHGPDPDNGYIGSPISPGNVFDGLMTGIISSNSIMSVYGAQFRNIHYVNGFEKSGRGIFAEGNSSAPHFLYQRGLGHLMEVTPFPSPEQTPSFTNCDYGIELRNVNAGISNNKMVNVAVGVSVRDMPNRTLDLSRNRLNCNLNAVRINQAGAFSSLSVDNNTIIMENGNASTALEGIIITDNESENQTAATISNNQIELLQGTTGVALTACIGYRVRNNFIGLYQPNQVGISLLGGREHFLNCNRMAAIPGNTNTTGIMTTNSLANDYNCNAVVSTNLGMRFVDACNMTNLRGNHFELNDIGLLLDLAIFNPQPHKGNTWHGNAFINEARYDEPYPDAASDAQFFVDENDDLDPNDDAILLPLNPVPGNGVWFVSETFIDGDTYVCPSEEVCTAGTEPYALLSDTDCRIARGKTNKTPAIQYLL